ncbi:hypothetical protein LTR08_002707 [Meristemomyces frigidus]|nr:hypothetical protein LTR08_002707 [Meristemomyces frigidus]
MANTSLLENINATFKSNSWESHCINLLSAAGSSFDWRDGLVNIHGQLVPGLTTDTWGIDVETCFRYCSASDIPYALNFNFQEFAASMTNYFLPWLALTAQLPFETGSPWSNVMSFCMALGSPALITYSLTVTIFNRYWIKERFSSLQHAAAENERIREGLRAPQNAAAENGRLGAALGERIKAALYLLQEAQQVPLRASQVDGWLSSLIVLSTNAPFWRRLKKHLRSTRRVFTASLVAQMMFAGIAYLFTVISSFTASLGDPATALQIASGSLWIWLIPVILGWITVGTQNSDHSIEDALSSALEGAVLATSPSNQVPAGNQRVTLDEQEKIYVLNEKGSGLQPRREENSQSNQNNGIHSFEGVGTGHIGRLTWWGANIGGDEQLKGGQNVQGDQPQLEQTGKQNHNGLSSRTYQHMVAASATALFVQWGTTGASVFIAYLTPTVGLGCRSTGYIVYGILGTAVWLFLLISMLLSHAAMLKYQDLHVSGRPSIDLQEHIRGPGHTALCAAAVITRYIGKAIAIVNTIWLILSSLLEYVGAYSNCYCKSDYLGLRKKGWVVLFKSAEDLALAAKPIWGGGLAMALGVCIISYAVFAHTSYKEED